MNKSALNPDLTKITWVWRKQILPSEQEAWAKRLDEKFSKLTWGLQILSSRRVIVEVFSPTNLPLMFLKAQHGGKLEPITDESWLKPAEAKPLKLGKKLVIGHDSEPHPTKSGGVPRIDIPFGMAFGSGEHETTEMLLRELTCQTICSSLWHY